MKTKKLLKRLELNKNTVANLELSFARGGRTTATCPPACATDVNCTLAGCITLVEPECVNTKNYCTWTNCTFYC